MGNPALLRSDFLILFSKGLHFESVSDLLISRRGPQNRTWRARFGPRAASLTFLSYTEVITKFLGNVKDPDYQDIVKDILISFQKLGCLMSLKGYFLHAHLEYFLENLDHRLCVKNMENAFIRTSELWKEDNKDNEM